MEMCFLPENAIFKNHFSLDVLLGLRFVINRTFCRTVNHYAPVNHGCKNNGIMFPAHEQNFSSIKNVF